MPSLSGAPLRYAHARGSKELSFFSDLRHDSCPDTRLHTRGLFPQSLKPCPSERSVVIRGEFSSVSFVIKPNVVKPKTKARRISPAGLKIKSTKTYWLLGVPATLAVFEESLLMVSLGATTPS